MPPKTKKPPSKQPPPKKPTAKVSSVSPGLIVVIAVAAVALIALVVVVITQATGGSDTAGLSQTQPVVVDGTPLPRLEDPASDPAKGQPAPTLEGKSFDGSNIIINAGDDKPKLVLFFAHWCPHCQAELPRIISWAKAGAIPEGVEVYGVATPTDSAKPNYPPSAWLHEIGWTYPTLADSKESTAADAYGLPGWPYFVTVGADGKVVARDSGELTEAQFTALMNQLSPG